MFTTGETVGLAEWIIDDTCLVLIDFELLSCQFKSSELSSKFYSFGTIYLFVTQSKCH